MIGGENLPMQPPDSSETVAEKPPEWLPSGWNVQVKVQKGRKIKCYIEPGTGSRFYSKPQVDRHLETLTWHVDAVKEKSAGVDSVNIVHPITSPTQPVSDGLTGAQSSRLDLTQDDTITMRESCPSKEKKIYNDNDSHNEVVVESVPADELPPGWIKEMRERKSSGGKRDPYYVDPQSGYMFRSKKDALRYLETGNIRSCVMRPKKRDANDMDMKINDTSAVVEGAPADEFPPGFTKETRHRKSMPVTDSLAGAQSLTSDLSPKDRSTTRVSSTSGEKKICSDIHSNDEAVVERVPVDELPPGWIKETRERKSMDGKKDPYYVDPQSGYMFRSKKDALRFLETGDIKSCVMKPKKRETNDMDMKISETSPVINGLTGAQSSRLDLSLNDRTPKRACGTSEEKKIRNDSHSNNEVVIERVPADELPPGWIKETRERMDGKKDTYYMDPQSGYMFRSKKDALRFSETGDIKSCVVKPKKRETDDMDMKIKEASPVIDGLTGGQSSRADISQNKKISKRASGVSGEKKTFNDNQSNNEVVTQRVLADKLPPGWVKENIKRKSMDGKTDPYYVDPLSGYMFRSKKDALRYLETGNIKSCIMRPKKRETPVEGETPIEGKMNDVDMNTNDKSAVVVGAPADELPPGWIRVTESRRDGKKDPYYVDPVSGYMFRSKKDAFRYLETGDIKSCVMKPKKREANDMVMKIDVNAKPLSMVERVPADELPPGWIKETRMRSIDGRKDPYYVDPETGYKFRSKKEALRYLETGDIKRSTARPKIRETNDADLKSNENTAVVKRVPTGELPPEWITKFRKRKSPYGLRDEPWYVDPSNGQVFSSKKSALRYLENIDTDSSPRPKKKKTIDMDMKTDTYSDVTEIVSADGLPSGWIKEIRQRSMGDVTRSDPYYIDPDSGYVFRSKKDALRYLESGDINKCAIRPKKRGTNDLDMRTDEKSSTPAAVGKKSKRRTATKKLQFSGKGNSITTPNEGSSSQDHAQTKGDEPGSTPSTDILKEKRLEKQRATRKKPNLSNSKRKAVELSSSPPIRSSKRLASVNTEIPAKPGLDERALQGEDRVDSGHIEPNLSVNVEAHKPTLEVEPGPKIDVGEKTQPNIDPSNRIPSMLENQVVSEDQPMKNQVSPKEQPTENLVFSEPPKENLVFSEEQRMKNQVVSEEEQPMKDQVVSQEEQPVRNQVFSEEQPTEGKPKPQNSQIFDLFGETWTDPCLEFAYRTLTGAMPLEEEDNNMDIHQESFQQEPEKYGPSDNIPTDRDLPEKQGGPTEQFTGNPTNLPSSGNVTVPPPQSTVSEASNVQRR